MSGRLAGSSKGGVKKQERAQLRRMRCKTAKKKIRNKRDTPEKDARADDCKEYARKGMAGNLSVMSGPWEGSWGDKAKALD